MNDAFFAFERERLAEFAVVQVAKRLEAFTAARIFHFMGFD